MFIWYIFPDLVCCTEKNLAILDFTNPILSRSFQIGTGSRVEGRGGGPEVDGHGLQGLRSGGPEFVAHQHRDEPRTSKVSTRTTW
jgi:hypothetical protein